MKHQEQVSHAGAKSESKPAQQSLRLPLRLCTLARNKLFCLMALLVLTALLLSACNRSSAAEDKSKIHVGIVFDIGGKDDRSFNAAAWAGVRCAETGKWPNGTDCGKPK